MNIDKYSRTKYFKKNTVNGIQEPDMLTNSLADFEFKREHKFHTIDSSDLQRPDLIAYRTYGKMNYWWIILKVNSIEDIWTDLKVGDVLKLPNPTDIEDFIASKR